MTKVNIIVLPTTGTIYTKAEVEADAIALNTNLGYYTNFVNLIDLCAIPLPCGFRANGLPSGITFNWAKFSRPIPVPIGYPLLPSDGRYLWQKNFCRDFPTNL
ncbi:MAG: hypothetical protein RMZ41_031550 [Nostoc sp. DedVER02]|uniref:hypothetical protein n=1 Tax=unclassified Nostoc TaxID=2593658 RepID=UPI002AD52857|nr:MULTISPECIES: hypothetical protein [unclassified Nostoc]MDZ7988643.1 hypothetical protein [Nostoc sp. DedVER02]MDZ8114012.1 hypothetical protein [Nostoc sp. DedVER01b]